MLQAIFDIWLNRDYKLYDQLTNETHTPDKWPLAHDFRLYVRKDISNQMWDQHIGPVVSAQPAVDPYLKGRRDIAAVQVIGEPGDAQGQFNAPHGLAIAPDGSLYVADSNNHRIQKFDSSGKFLMAFGTFSGPNNPNPAPGTFNEPWGVTVGPDGSVYVADTWNHRIQKFDATGKFITTWGVAGQTDMGGQGGIFWGPRDVAAGKDGRVYVSDAGNKRIQVFNADGAFQAQFGGAGVQPGQLDEPVGLAIAPDGNLIVNDTWNQRIQVLSPDGQPIRQWEIKGWVDQSVTNKPYVAVDKDGNIYTTDPTGFRVLVFGPDGTFKATFGDFGTDEKSFQLPIGIAVDANGDVYVSDAGLARILKFPPVK
jgi:sugar lactone lactonase YvrE